MRRLRMSFLWPAIFAALSLFAMPAFAESMGDAGHKVVIQVSTDDLRTQTIAMNNAVNLQKHYGVDNVDVEIVAFGPGLRLMFKDNVNSGRIQTLTGSGVKFSACKNTIAGMAKILGHEPELNSNAVPVSAGVVRIIELQNQGFKLIKP